SVFLSSPETAAASVLKGEITDPRTMDMPYPKVTEPKDQTVDDGLLDKPLPEAEAKQVEIIKGPNIKSIPDMAPMPDHMELPILLKMGDNISTDEILAGGARVLPFRSNLPEISKFTFEIIDDTYYKRAMDIADDTGHAVVGGCNYGQGSSRAHAALAPRYLGMHVALVKDFARIHWQNRANFGILPLTFVNEEDYDLLESGDVLVLDNMKQHVRESKPFMIKIKGKDKEIEVAHAMSERQKEIMLTGGIINWVKERA